MQNRGRGSAWVLDQGDCRSYSVRLLGLRETCEEGAGYRVRDSGGVEKAVGGGVLQYRGRSRACRSCSSRLSGLRETGEEGAAFGFVLGSDERDIGDRGSGLLNQIDAGGMEQLFVKGAERIDQEGEDGPCTIVVGSDRKSVGRAEPGLGGSSRVALDKEGSAVGVVNSVSLGEGFSEDREISLSCPPGFERPGDKDESSSGERTKSYEGRPPGNCVIQTQMCRDGDMDEAESTWEIGKLLGLSSKEEKEVVKVLYENRRRKEGVKKGEKAGDKKGGRKGVKKGGLGSRAGKVISGGFF